MVAISSEIMRQFFAKADGQLNGEWVIIGGSVLSILGIEDRVTLDIDIASLLHTSQKETIVLMEIAQDIGLPIEAINQAAAFFLEKIPDWRGSLVEVFHGKNCRFFRPDVNLYVQLKIARLSESDLSDCLHMLRFAQEHKEIVNKVGLAKAIADKQATCDSEGVKARLEVLLRKIQRMRG